MNKILIKNIYYMLSYAFRTLKQNNFKKIETEEFERIDDLFSEILFQGVSQQLKQGLYKEYVVVNNDLTTIKGRINFPQTIRNRTNQRIEINCEYDEFSENNLFNQIIKSTIYELIKKGGVLKERKQKLKKIVVFFSSVDFVDLNTVNWSSLKLQRYNQSYEMLLNICYFVYMGIIQSEKSGNKKMMTFSDDHLATLYEHFILQYYKSEHKNLRVTSSTIRWNIPDDLDESIIKFLPQMKSDIMVYNPNTKKTLIIDAKFYSKTLQTNYNKDTFHSNNLYQIFAYVKNYDVHQTGQVSGLLLYAKSNIDLIGNYDYPMSGNMISVRTLDLNQDFSIIKQQLDKIITTIS